MDYAMSIGFDLCALDFSPIRGPEGNIEYLIHLKNAETDRAKTGGLNRSLRWPVLLNHL